MVIGLKEALEEYFKNICSEEHGSFFDYGVIYDYFTESINLNYPNNISLSEFLGKYFRKPDIIESCIYYCENSNVKRVSGVNKFLKALTKFCNEYMKPVQAYYNPTLFALLPFTQLKEEVLINIDKELGETETSPAISADDFIKICLYFNKITAKTIVQKQLSIMLKLIGLYGFKLEKIRSLEKDSYDSKYNKLFIDGVNREKIGLELADSLSEEIENYLSDPECNKTNLLFLNSNDQIIKPIFFSDNFRKIEETLHTSVRLTTTGIAKFAIKNMLSELSIEQVKIISGMENTIVDACDKEVMDQVGKDIEGKVNANIRKIRYETRYDKIIKKAEE